MNPFLLACIMMIMCSTAGEVCFAGDPCLACHEKTTPGIVQYWKKSVHFQKQVACVGCHGDDIEANHQRTAIVDASKCGACHKPALEDHRTSKHGMSIKAGLGCTRSLKKAFEQQPSCTLCHEPGSAKPRLNVECAMFLAQSPSMQRQGCSACHQVESRCDTCHTKHGTDLDLARDPGVCGTCHMGPDHPQAEMWETSRHGVLYKQAGKESAPSCVTCHMQAGSHNVSRGISAGLPKKSTGRRTQERERMLTVCSECHSKTFSARNLADADAIEEQSRAIVTEAQLIIEGLQKDGLLSPSPAERPAHPLFGTTFVIGPHMLYENLSFVESLFFRMKSFYAITAYKGAFHQNPDYAHWYGNAPLKLTLSEIKSQAALLRQVDSLRKRLDNIGTDGREEQGEISEIKKRLRALNEKRLKGEIGEQEYLILKNKLFEEKGL